MSVRFAAGKERSTNSTIRYSVQAVLSADATKDIDALLELTTKVGSRAAHAMRFSLEKRR